MGAVHSPISQRIRRAVTHAERALANELERPQELVRGAGGPLEALGAYKRNNANVIRTRVERVRDMLGPNVGDQERVNRQRDYTIEQASIADERRASALLIARLATDSWVRRFAGEAPTSRSVTHTRIPRIQKTQRINGVCRHTV